MSGGGTSPPRWKSLGEFLAHWATAIVTPLALLTTLAALLVTCSEYKTQNRLIALSFQVSSIYQALKDARTLGQDYHNGKATEQDVFGTIETVYLIHRLGGIPSDAWPVFNKDYCITMKDDHLRNTWTNEDKTYYWDKFVSYMDDLVRGKDCEERNVNG